MLMKLRTVIALILLLLFFSVSAPNFLSVGSLLIVAKHVAINAFMAVGMTFVILTGGIDLSVGSIVGLSGIVAGGLINSGVRVDPLHLTVYPSVIVVILMTLGLGALIGAFNGLIITRLRVTAFIGTLGMLYIVRGSALLISGGATIANLVGRPELGNMGFPLLGDGTVFGIPFPLIALTALAVVATYVTTRTPFGRQLYAVGGNERAALVSGVRVERIKTIAYIISGVCAAFAGLVVSSELVAAHPASGESFELNAIAAAVLGGTSLTGGVGSISGTVVGAFVIGVLNDGMVMMDVSSFWQMVIKGSVIITAVMLDQFQRRIQHQLALQAPTV